MSSSTPRSNILAAAIDVLDRQGADALTVRNVAAGAGCSTTGVYTHFGGKQGLVEAIFVDGFDSFDAALERGGDSLEDLCLSYRSWAASRPTHYQVMFGRAVPEFRPSASALARAGESFERLVDRVRHHTDPGFGDARQLAFHIWATVHGYVMLEMLDMFPVDLGTPDELYGNGLGWLLTGLPTAVTS